MATLRQAIALIASTVSAQIINVNSGSSRGQLLCGDTGFDGANASSIITFPVDWRDEQQSSISRSLSASSTATGSPVSSGTAAASTPSTSLSSVTAPSAVSQEPAALLSTSQSAATATGQSRVKPRQASGNRIVNVPDPSWAISVASANDTLHTTIWYDTAGQNYSDDLNINYDACAFMLADLPENTIRLGQDDEGNCHSTLSWDCQSELLKRASLSAQQWTTYTSPPPYQNLSAGVLPTLCSYIQRDLFEQYPDGTRWPRQCYNDLGSGVPGQGQNASASSIALTGFNSSILDNTCTVQSSNKTFHQIWTTLDSMATDADAAYDNVTSRIFPVISVYFSVANVERTSFTSYANSTMSCLRAKEFSVGSRVSPALPEGTPYPSDGGGEISGSTIAGIVVGVVAALVMLGLGAWWFVRRRKARGAKAQVNESDSLEKDRLPEADGRTYHELHREDKKPEIDNGTLPEMGNAQGMPGELYGSEVQR